MRRTGYIFQIILSLAILAAMIYLTWQVIILSKSNQEKKIDLSEIDHVRYGLLNVDEWEEKIAVIITQKINEFELVPENRENLQASMERVLHRLIDEFEQLLELRTSGKFSGFKKWVAGFAVDIEELRENVPEFAESILEELNKPETRAEIEAFLLAKLDEFVATTFNKDSMLMLEELIKKYGCEDKESCHVLLKDLINKDQDLINRYVVIILSLLVLIFLLNITIRGPLSIFQVLLLILSSFCLLLAGVLTPMIELEARIDLMLFQLVGEEIIFKEQIFFFQSKSIINVVQILINDGSVQMIFVGALIFTFSVVFPTLKLFCSFLYSASWRLRENRIIKFFVIKSGKWSMADVMVVAMFMAYIGFNGVVSSQLKNLSDAAKPVEILSTNGTQLVGGFYLFLGFCLAGLILSEALVRKTDSYRY